MKIKFTELQKIEIKIDELLEELSIWQTMPCHTQRQRENAIEHCDDLEEQISQLMYKREALDW